MVHCNESSPDTGGVGSYPLTRAGLRRPPRGVEPTAVFVVIEMAVLFCVSALAMVSIIVTIDDDVTGQPAQHVSRADDRSAPVASHGGAASANRYVAQDATPKKSTGQGAR